jgi:hypothetical protein
MLPDHTSRHDPESGIQVVREQAVRRVPVMDGRAVAGIVSVGDLAERLDPHSMLADISTVPANP